MKTERMLPGIYNQSWDMRTLSRICDLEYDLVSYYTQHILDCYSPQHCPENLLPELAAHIGFDYNEFKTDNDEQEDHYSQSHDIKGRLLC